MSVALVDPSSENPALDTARDANELATFSLIIAFLVFALTAIAWGLSLKHRRDDRDAARLATDRIDTAAKAETARLDRESSRIEAETRAQFNLLERQFAYLHEPALRIVAVDGRTSVSQASTKWFIQNTGNVTALDVYVGAACDSNGKQIDLSTPFRLDELAPHSSEVLIPQTPNGWPHIFMDDSVLGSAHSIVTFKTARLEERTATLTYATHLLQEKGGLIY